MKKTKPYINAIWRDIKELFKPIDFEELEQDAKKETEETNGGKK